MVVANIVDSLLGINLGIAERDILIGFGVILIVLVYIALTVTEIKNKMK